MLMPWPCWASNGCELGWGHWGDIYAAVAAMQDAYGVQGMLNELQRWLRQTQLQGGICPHRRCERDALLSCAVLCCQHNCCTFDFWQQHAASSADPDGLASERLVMPSHQCVYHIRYMPCSSRRYIRPSITRPLAAGICQGCNAAHLTSGAALRNCDS